MTETEPTRVTRRPPMPAAPSAEGLVRLPSGKGRLCGFHALEREAVSLDLVLLQDVPLVLVRQGREVLLELGHHLGLVLRMGEVRCPQDSVGTEEPRARRQVPLAGVETDVALPLEVLAGQDRQPLPFEPDQLDLFVHTLEL